MLFLRLFKESVLFALNALVVNKLRTFLSLLGISIGIFTIITVFTLVDSLENNLNKSVQKLGNDAIYVQKWPWDFGSDYPWWKYFNRPSPSYQDFEKIQKRAGANIKAVAFQISINDKTVKYRNKNVENVNVIAASHDFDQTRVLDFERGRYFTVADSRSGKNYVLLGFEVAKGLFENADPVGQTVKISGRNLKVLGVFKKEGEDILNSSIDNAVLIPINYARNIVDTKSDNFDPKIIIKAASNITLNELASEMKGQIRAIRRLSPREEDDFSLNQSSMLSLQLDSLFGVVNIAGWIIGGFSILVGGFGIANIMFVSVKERTNIIGIQKSLGAKNYFILLQFLVEAVVLSIIGGIIGLIIVYIITLVAAAFDFELVLSLANCVLGLGVSAIIGVISGFLPAWNASQLNPVDAIRAK